MPRPPSTPMISIIINTAGGSPPQRGIILISSSCQPSFSSPSSLTPFPCRVSPHLRKSPPRFLVFLSLLLASFLLLRRSVSPPFHGSPPLPPALLEVIDRGNPPLTDKGAGRLEERSRLIPSPGTEAFRQHEGAGRSENGVGGNDIGPFCISPHHGLRRLEVLLRPGHETISPGQVRIDRLHQAFCLELLKDHGLTRSGESSSPAEPPAG